MAPDQDPAPAAVTRPRWTWKAIAIPLVTAAIVYLQIRFLAGFDRFADALAGVRWELVAIPIALVTFNVWLSVIRWRLVLAAMGFAVPLGAGLNAVLATWPLALVVPSRGGDVLRAVSIRRFVPIAPGIGSVLAEKLVDIQSLCLLAATGTAIHGLWWWCAGALAAVAAEWVVVLALLRHRDRVVQLPVLRRAADKVHRVLDAFEALLRRPAYFAGVSCVSLVAWLVSIAIVFVLLHMTGADIPWQPVLTLWPLATFVGIVPVTMAGMGTRDAAFLYLLGAIVPTVDAAPVLLATLGYSLFATWMFGVIGLPFAIREASRALDRR